MVKKHAVITTIEDRKLVFIFENEEIAEIDVIADDNKVKLDGIYTARVTNIVKNINAAFLSVNDETLYYDLGEKNPVFLNNKNDNVPHQGDLMLVQVSREAIKQKNASATSKLNIFGENLVLTLNVPGVGASKKLSKDDKDRLKAYFSGFDTTLDNGMSFGIVIRTSAVDVDKDDLIKEARVLKSKLNSIMEAAAFAPSNKMLYDPKNEYNSILGKVGADEGSYVITDDKEVYDELNALCEVRVSDADIRFHNDENITLRALYDLKKYLGLALSKNVWLKNGGYLVIEHTEALNVIDVNTGKSIEGKKAKEKHVFETNMLAAKEVARQLRLRNMSGIIVVDFIDMNGKEYNDKLMSELKNQLKSDPIHANVIDITALGLVEITRKKVKKPLYEIF